MASLKKSLTDDDDDLRVRLKEYGITTPVTASTRSILIKKLNHAIANQKKKKKKSTPRKAGGGTPPRRSSFANRLHTLSSDEDEDEDYRPQEEEDDENDDDEGDGGYHHYHQQQESKSSSIQYSTGGIGRTSIGGGRLSRRNIHKRDSVFKSTATEEAQEETPVSDRNGDAAAASSLFLRRSKFSSYSPTTTTSSYEPVDVRPLRGMSSGSLDVAASRSNSNINSSSRYRNGSHRPPSANSSLSNSISSHSEEPVSKRTKFSLGTYIPSVCGRAGVSPRAKIRHVDYDTGSDSDPAEREDAVDLSARASASLPGGYDGGENDSSSFGVRSFYQNHKLGGLSPSDRLVSTARGDSVRNRELRQTYLENGRRHENECVEDRERGVYSVADPVASQTSPPGSHEPTTRVANGRHHSESNCVDPSPGVESTWHYSIPLLLLVLLAVFFGVVAMLYVNMRIPLLPVLQSVPAMFLQAMAKLPVPFLARTDPQKQVQSPSPSQPAALPVSPSSHSPENRIPICNSDVTAACLTRPEVAAFQQIALRIEDVLLPALELQEGQFQCGESAVRYMSIADIQTLLHDSQIISDHSSIDSIVALGKLSELNRHWGLEAVRDGETLLGISLISPPTHVLCHIRAAIYSLFHIIMGVILATIACWLTFTYVKYHRNRTELEKQQVFEMVEQIVELLGGLVGPNGKESIAVKHVRDSLIIPRERKAKINIWKKAVQFIDDHESRIRREIQTVEGEDCEIWRWTSGVPHSPGNSLGLDGAGGRPPAKVWQGQAFENLETTNNLPNVSPTSCLKIRNMFDCDVEFGDSWPSRIQDSILEKCEGISIVHVAVDRGSREGCVYLKCASLVEAGRAFRALHGWWYDGNLVTVKFLRDERYHQRFPNARHAICRLRPSNNKRLSLQVPPGQQSDSVEHP